MLNVLSSREQIYFLRNISIRTSDSYSVLILRDHICSVSLFSHTIIISVLRKCSVIGKIRSDCLPLQICSLLQIAKMVSVFFTAQMWCQQNGPEQTETPWSLWAIRNWTICGHSSINQVGRNNTSSATSKGNNYENEGQNLTLWARFTEQGIRAQFQKGKFCVFYWQRAH